MEKNAPLPDIPDLLYPTADKREALNRRRIELSDKFPCTYLNDLMTDTLASMICRRNPQNVQKLFREMCTDTDVINYRLDALEDVINNPKLSPALHNAAKRLLETEEKNRGGNGSPDSFTALGDRIEMLDSYIACMEELDRLSEELGKCIRSEAFVSFFEIIKGRCDSEDFAQMKRDITELKDAFSKKIRSVTVAINFNAEMRPVSAGIVNFSDKPAGEKPNVFDRLFYKTSAFSDTVVSGKLRSGLPNEDGYLSEADKALFDALEKLTSSYMRRLESALKAYDRLSFSRLSMLSDQLEIYDGIAKIADSCTARGLKMCRPEFTDKPRTAEIINLFDPCFYFKAAAADSEAKGDELVVRNSLSMDENGRFFVLTGANNGGKTTFVRGVGLCFLMAQTGFYVPAESCKISLCDFIFTHFPKEEETGINASRFTTEIKDIRIISDLITENSLLLMNESIQSTTPKECAEIASELVRIFCIIGVRGIFATHITELAAACESISADPDCRSVPVSIVAAVDENSGKRLYRIDRGMPMKQSYARDIFDSFGISIERVRKRAQRS
ncbi:MAG: DNA mismatch repair protein MutS [Oscillospiraceae bacterium]|nr:DNA mismatch repair protein MutS [Oscillospiraceae bacterium]